jgi:hypothetical protein
MMDFPNLVSVTRRAFASIKSVVSGFSDAQKSARTTAEHQGWIDGVGIEVSRFVIHGWAMSPDESPARVLCSYAGVPYCTAIADQYRPDVELTDRECGSIGLAIPFPCDPDEFDPRLFEACHGDGTLLGRTVEFLAWTAPPEFRNLAGLDLLASPLVESAFIEITSRCNLRCVYCAVSQPDYVGQDMPADLLDEVISILKARQVKFMQVNAHGETTMVPGWHHLVNELAEAGVELQIITNFARLLSTDELAAMARIRRITISIDTHRPEVLRSIRRRVSLKNILTNMANTKAKAAELNLPPPQFIWCSVMTDRVAPDFVDYLRFGIALGVKDFFIANLTKHDDVADAENVNHVTTLPDAELISFSRMLDEGSSMVRRAGGYIDLSPGLVDTVEQELVTRGLK